MFIIFLLKLTKWPFVFICWVVELLFIIALLQKSRRILFITCVTFLYNFNQKVVKFSDDFLKFSSILICYSLSFTMTLYDTIFFLGKEFFFRCFMTMFVASAKRSNFFAFEAKMFEDYFETNWCNSFSKKNYLLRKLKFKKLHLTSLYIYSSDQKSIHQNSILTN